MFEFVFYDSLYNLFEHRLHPFQLGFQKHIFTLASLTYFNTVVPSVSTQRHTDSVYFDLSNVSDIVLQNLHLCKFSFFWLSSGYVKWFHRLINIWSIDSNLFGFMEPFHFHNLWCLEFCGVFLINSLMIMWLNS